MPTNRVYSSSLGGGGGGAGSALTDGHIFVGSAANIATDVAMSGEATIVNSGAVTLTNSAVIGKVLTGYVSGAGTVAATDTILQAIQKLNGNAAVKIGGSTGATDNRILRADGTGGVTLQSSAVTMDDSGNITGIGGDANRLYCDASFNDFYVDAGSSTGHSGTAVLHLQSAGSDRLNISATENTSITALRANVDFEMIASSQTITSDNQTLTVNNTSHLRLTSDNGTAANRDFILGDGRRSGQLLWIEWVGDSATAQGELPNNTANNVRLNPALGAWTIDNTAGKTYSNILLIWDNTDGNWIEVCRTMFV